MNSPQGMVVAAVALPISGWIAFRCLQNIRVVSRLQARGIYDKHGSTANDANDAESGYGGPTSAAVARMGEFETAESVMEYGCGRGKLMRALLANQALSETATVTCIDQSEVMVQNAKRALEQFGARVSVRHLPTGNPRDVQEQTVDRFVSCYVLDLLSDADIGEVLALARRTLKPKDGRLVLAGITYGSWRMPITVYWTLRWELKRLWNPAQMGGCRPQRLAEYLDPAQWKVVTKELVFPVGRPWMCSEIVVAQPL